MPRIEELEEEWERLREPPLCVTDEMVMSSWEDHLRLRFAIKWLPDLLEIVKSLERSSADYRTSRAYQRHAENVLYYIQTGQQVQGEKKDEYVAQRQKLISEQHDAPQEFLQVMNDNMEDLLA